MVESKREIGEKIEEETRLSITSLVWLACQTGARHPPSLGDRE